MDFGSMLSAVGSPVMSLVQMNAAKQEAQRNRRFQEDMSSTAHQREVADLKAAGLNPILSAGGRGASTPGGSQASLPDLSAGVSRGVQSAVALKQGLANAKLTEVDAKMASDMYKLYNSNEVLKKGVLTGMLTQRAGGSKLSGLLGAGLGAGVSAGQLLLNKWRDWSQDRKEARSRKEKYEAWRRDLDAMLEERDRLPGAVVDPGWLFVDPSSPR